ncbi:peptidase M1 family protein, partial [Vibrio parahaemolyticus V-223/04]
RQHVKTSFLQWKMQRALNLSNSVYGTANLVRQHYV